MKKTLLGILVGAVLALTVSQPAEASLFISLTDSVVTKTCDNSTAGGVTACGLAGFTTVLNSNNIGFGPGFTVGGWTVGGFSGLTTNVPGTAVFGNVADSKLNVSHDSGALDLTVDFAAYNFTLPTGPNLTLSSSNGANWAISTAGDSAALQGWGRSDNLPTVPGGTSTAISPTLVSPGGSTGALGSQSPDVLFTRLVTNYALTGREVLHAAVGTIGTYSAQVTVFPTAVPEPASMLLLGTGLLGLARRRMRRG